MSNAKMLVLAKAKPLFLTSTFWLNALGIGLEVGQALLDARIVSSQTLVVALTIGNVLNRLRTKQPATVTGEGGKPVEAAPPPKPPTEPLGTPM